MEEQVNVGEEENRQIVCGAPNIRAGIKVMVALPGARITDNYKIKKGKIRGLESLGMICSLSELGISDSVVPKEFADGIQILPEEAVYGHFYRQRTGVRRLADRSRTASYPRTRRIAYLRRTNGMAHIQVSFCTPCQRETPMLHWMGR